MFRPPLALCVLTVSLSSLCAQQDGPPINAELVLRELAALEDKQKQTHQQALTSAINTLRPGSGGGAAASTLYQSAVEATRFEGLKDKVTAFIDWKKQNSDLLRSSEMQTALGLHIRYLLLSIQRNEAEDGKQFVQPSLDYVEDLRQFLGSLEKLDKVPDPIKDLMDKGINDSVFTKWLRLGSWLPDGKQWEANPGNLRGILEKNVRVVLREEKSPKVIETWDYEMTYEADRVTTGRLAHAADSFNTVNRPKMQFSRANDLVLIGQKNRGTTEILGLVRAYPQHPDFGTWVARLKELLAPPAAAPVP
ncbi:MAG: hypothetical protein WEB60_04265 [Terrimicrobiaceae bacterium]